MIEPLNPTELRVLGALAEKAATVPDTYPMTLKGLQTACNQKNSRDPVTDLDTFTIQQTLDGLKARGLVRFVYASHGARSTKYRHVLDEQLDLEAAELALLVVLALRGPQTVNELRTRTERAHHFEDLGAVDETLSALAGRDHPLVVLLPRQVGQKEQRWMHLLAGDADAALAANAADAGPTAAAADAGESGGSVLRSGDGDRVGALERRVAELEATLERVLGELGMARSPGNAENQSGGDHDLDHRTDRSADALEGPTP